MENGGAMHALPCSRLAAHRSAQASLLCRWETYLMNAALPALLRHSMRAGLAHTSFLHGQQESARVLVGAVISDIPPMHPRREKQGSTPCSNNSKELSIEEYA